MPSFQTLANTPFSDILEVFNEAFSDYLVPFFLTAEQLQNKIKSEGIRLDLSVGAFDDDRLVGFVLHGYALTEGRGIAYNGGTGVLPTHRGQKLTAQMYAYIMPVLRTAGIDRVILEVIATNKPALKTYRQIGFETVRQLHCFKGPVQIDFPGNSENIQVLNQLEWPVLRSLWDMQPSWQNTENAIEKLQNVCVGVGYFEAGRLLGYLILNPNTRRIQQLAVHPEHRRQGIGRQLLGHVADTYGRDLYLINADSRYEDTLLFMTYAGMDNYINQYEMTLLL